MRTQPNGRNAAVFSRGSKGNAVVDGVLIIVLLFIFGLGSIFSNMVFDDVNADLQNDTEASEYAKNVSGQLYDKHSNLMDNLFIMLFVLIIAGAIVSVFMLDTHPIFFVFTIVLLLAMFIVAALLGNAFDDTVSDSALSAYAAKLPYTTWVVSHILELSIVIGFIMVIALFAKLKS